MTLGIVHSLNMLFNTIFVFVFSLLITQTVTVYNMTLSSTPASKVKREQRRVKAFVLINGKLKLKMKATQEALLSIILITLNDAKDATLRGP